MLFFEPPEHTIEIMTLRTFVWHCQQQQPEIAALNLLLLDSYQKPSRDGREDRVCRKGSTTFQPDRYSYMTQQC